MRDAPGAPPRPDAPPPALDRRLAALFLAGAALLLLLGLGQRDLWAPDEPRYAQIAEELRSFRHGAEGLVLLHLDGEAYTQKPPLYFWLAALAGAPGGHVSETAARLPSALSALGLLALTIGLGASLLGGRAALWGAALLLSSYTFAEIARRVQLDMLLALLETTALLGFWRLDRGLGGRRTNLALLHGGMGLAVLTKGPVGFLVPVLVIAAYLAWERRPRALGRALHPAWLLLSLGPALAWLALAWALAPPGWFGEAVGENVFGRFFAGTSHERPVWYFLTQYPLEALPWSLLWPWVGWVAVRDVLGRDARASASERRAWRFLLAWVGASFLFFSLSSGKRGLYLLPTFPAAVLLCGAAIDRRLPGLRRLPRKFDVGGAVAAALLVGLAVTALVVRRFDSVLVPLFVPLTLLAIVAAAAAAWVVLARRRVSAQAQLAVAVAAVVAVEVGAFAAFYPALDPEKSTRPFSVAAAELAPDGRVGLVSDEALTGGIAYYGDVRVENLDDSDDVRRFLASGGRVFVVKERKVGRIEAVTPVEVRFSARSGRRKIVVVVPADEAVSAPRG